MPFNLRTLQWTNQPGRQPTIQRHPQTGLWMVTRQHSHVSWHPPGLSWQLIWDAIPHWRLSFWGFGMVSVQIMYMYMWGFFSIYLNRVKHSATGCSPMLPCVHIISIHIKYRKYIKSIFRGKRPKMRNIIASVYEQCMTIHIKHKWQFI